MRALWSVLGASGALSVSTGVWALFYYRAGFHWDSLAVGGTVVAAALYKLARGAA
jgi:hypothetical protein